MMNRPVRTCLRHHGARGTIIFLALAIAAPSLKADERLHGIACRSVHLQYSASPAKAFYNEVTIEQSAVGTYFMVCGWNGGYFGMQELANGKKVVLFSVWDQARGDNPNQVDDEQRVQVPFSADDVLVKRFGGEGTGGRSFYSFDWQPNTTYRFLVKAAAAGNRGEYAGYFYLPETKTWKHLVTFSTPNQGKPIEDCYAFVEDFRRNRVSTTHPRRARFGNGWVNAVTGGWQPLTKARFTADANPATNIDAGPADTGFYLATGGTIENANVPLWQSMEAKPAPAPPNDLP